MDAMDDPYQAPTLAYNRDVDQLVVTNTINSEVEEEEILELDDEEESKVLETTYSKDTMMDWEEEKEGTEPTTPRLKMGSNDVNSTPKEIGSPQYVQHIDGQYC
jgi:hypothetical protein